MEITEELKAKALACETAEELLELAAENGIELSAEEAGMEIESAGMGELLDRLMGSPSEHFVDAYSECNASPSYPNSNLGSFDDRRGR